MANYTSIHTGTAIDLAAGYSLEGQGVTLLSIAKAMGAGGTFATANGNITIASGNVQHLVVYTKTDSGGSNISDRPAAHAFSCEMFLTRLASTSDYGVRITFYDYTDRNPYIANITQATTSLSSAWSRLDTNTTYSTTSTVTSGSTALITSGGVYSAIVSVLNTAV